ncbi:hypothetical protein MMC29_001690 [Sticta canariensis]|nr:hypothetical protein [Sticta canariensis]
MTAVAAHPSVEINPLVITVAAQNLAWIVSCDRTVQIVKCDSDRVSFSLPAPSTDEETVMQTRISRDGHRFGTILVLNSEAQLEIIDLLSSRKADVLFSRRFQLPAGITQPICLSPNLDLFAFGSFAFTGDLKHFDQSPIDLDIDLKTPERDWSWPAYKHFQDCYDPQPGRSVIFEIDRTKRTASRLNTPPPENLQVSSLEFHPSLPLAARSYLQGEGRDNNSVSRQSRVPANAVSLAMVHLNDKNTVPLKKLLVDHHILSEIHIAASGDFAFLEEYQYKFQGTKDRLIVSNISYPPIPLRIMTQDQFEHPSKDRCYMLTAKPSSVAVTMYRFRTDAVGDDTLPVHQTVESYSEVQHITAWPSTLGSPKVWLLLGEDYSAPMKLLLGPTKQGPPVIKTLVLTWDELRDQLETSLKPVETSEASREDQRTI